MLPGGCAELGIVPQATKVAAQRQPEQHELAGDNTLDVGILHSGFQLGV